MTERSWAAGAVVGVLAVSGAAACGDTSAGPSDGATELTISIETAPPDTGPSDDLAPSQITASTVPAPAVPQPCDPDDVELWASRAVVDPVGGTADVVIRIVVDDEVMCDVDLSGSPDLSPDMEPDVWVDSARGGELYVSTSAGDCASGPSALPVVEVSVNGVPREVAVNTVAGCGHELVALLPLDDTTGACEASDLRARVLVGPVWLLVRNESDRVCSLGDLAGLVVDGAPWPEFGEVFPTAPRSRADAPIVLAPGDVAGRRLGLDSSYGCDPSDDAELTIAGAGDVRVEGFETCVFLDPGPAIPYLSDPNGPLADHGTSDFDIDVAFALLDPFSSPPGGA